MIKQILVRSKSKAKEFISDVPWAAISISTHENDWPKLNACQRVGLLQLNFYDREAGDNLFDEDMAQKVLDFVEEMQKKDIDILLVHCEAGISRSSAVAAALHHICLGGNDEFFFSRPYMPNKLVFRTLIRKAIKLNKIDVGRDNLPVFIKYEADTFIHQFKYCVQEWKEQRSPHSSMIETHLEPYQKICQMGQDVIPLLLIEMKDRPDWWFEALKVCSGEDPVPKEHHGYLHKMVDDWWQWGLEKGFIYE